MPEQLLSSPKQAKVLGLSYKRKADNDKLDPAVALYLPPKDIGEKEGAYCGACMMFVWEKGNTGHCTVVAGEINGPHGICGLYVHGEHSGPDMKGTISKKTAGYEEDGPTHCDNCVYFLRSQKACERISGTVEAQGCCNCWEGNEKGE
jgi:hypothetical protein